MPAQIGIIGGSGLYDMAELTDREEVTLSTPFGDPSGPYVLAHAARAARGVPGAPRRGPPADAERAELPGEHLRLQDARRRADPLGERRRQPEATSTRRRTSSSPTSSSTGRRGASARSSAAGWWRTSAFAHPVCGDLVGAWRTRRRAAVGARVHLGGTYVCMEGPQFSTLAESQAVPVVGRGRHRHDEPAGGEARARGGDLLRDARAGHRLRLLAPRARLGDRRDDRRQPDRRTRRRRRRSSPRRSAACRPRAAARAAARWRAPSSPAASRARRDASRTSRRSSGSTSP